MYCISADTASCILDIPSKSCSAVCRALGGGEGFAQNLVNANVFVAHAP